MNKSVSGHRQASESGGRRQKSKAPGSSRWSPPPSVTPDAQSPTLLTDVRELIVSTRQTVARGVNAALVLLYWKVGERIRRDVLKEKRAEYGEEIVSTLSRQLATEFGSGFAEKNLRRMIQFAELFPNGEIVATLSRELGWSHFVELLPLKKHEVRPGEEAPIGLILCAEKSDERVEMLELESRGIRIAEYLTELPPKDLLTRKLHDAVRLAQARLEAHSIDQPTAPTLPTPPKSTRRKRRP